MDFFIISCEHGGNHIPSRYRSLFLGQQAVLASHRGHDAGSLLMATELAEALRAPLVASTTSRLLVDLNRSIGHPHLFSATTRHARAEIRAEIVDQHYRPHRSRVEHLVTQAVSRGQRAIHIAAHSFTPELNGTTRNAHVGLLYDPARDGEAEFCAQWKRSLATLAPELRVRRNYPYAGKSDGLTSHLRRNLGFGEYVGVELEINQGIVSAGGARWIALRRVLIDALRDASAPSHKPLLHNAPSRNAPSRNAPSRKPLTNDGAS